MIEMIARWVTDGIGVGVSIFFAGFAVVVLLALAFGCATAIGSVFHKTGDGTTEAKHHDIHRDRPW